MITANPPLPCGIQQGGDSTEPGERLALYHALSCLQDGDSPAYGAEPAPLSRDVHVL